MCSHIFVKGEALKFLRTNFCKYVIPERKESLIEQTLENAEKDSNLCHAISTVIFGLEKHTYGQTASDTDTAVTWRDIQGASDPCSLIEKKNRQKTYFFKKKLLT